MSLDEVLAGKGQRFTGTTDVWYIAQRMAKYDPFIYLKGVTCRSRATVAACSK